MQVNFIYAFISDKYMLYVSIVTESVPLTTQTQLKKIILISMKIIYAFLV